MIKFFLQQQAALSFYFFKKNGECSWHLEPLLITYCSQSKFKEEIMKQLEESITSYKIFVVEATSKKR